MPTEVTEDANKETKLLPTAPKSFPHLYCSWCLMRSHAKRRRKHVNKTDSAIRITHLPTNTVVQCQNDRSQHRNRAQAMSMLRAKLYEIELKRREETNNQNALSKGEIGWGSQIRSYVLHPYQMVKDLRTNVEVGNTQSVLDGDLDIFIESALALKVGMKR